MKLVKKQVWHHIQDHVLDRVGNCVKDHVWERVDDYVQAQVRVRYYIRDRVWICISNNIRAQQ